MSQSPGRKKLNLDIQLAKEPLAVLGVALKVVSRKETVRRKCEADVG